MSSNSFRVASGLVIEDPNNPGSILLSIDSSNNIINTQSTISVNSSLDAVKITQTGAGNALVIEDSITPDASPFIVDSNGRLSVGNRNNLINFPNASIVAANTSSGIQKTESHNIGIMAEGTGNASNTSIYGVGVYGAGYTASATRSGGVIGEGHVSASSDTGSAIGVRGYANDTHAGGLNIGVLGEASGSNTGNYAFYSNSTFGANNYNLYIAGSALNYLGGDICISGVISTNATAPTIAASSTIAPTKMITFISGTAAPIANITPPSTIVSCGGGQITLLPTAAWTTNTAGNIALSSTAVVSKALIMTWDGLTGKWYPSY